MERVKVRLHSAKGEQDLRPLVTSQGGTFLPVLASLFLHYALDNWLSARHPSIHFCRYADDGVPHCKSLAEADLCVSSWMHGNVNVDYSASGKDPDSVLQGQQTDRAHEHVQFNFLGYTFRLRLIVRYKVSPV